MFPEKNLERKGLITIAAVWPQEIGHISTHIYKSCHHGIECDLNQHKKIINTGIKHVFGNLTIFVRIIFLSQVEFKNTVIISIQLSGNFHPVEHQMTLKIQINGLHNPTYIILI